ncbi:hypothetical protein V8B97DRAFT_360983 [Scleroderma yunnanense]
MVIDELTQVRTELERLEKKERDLHEQLSGVRVAIDAHKSKIEDLVRTKPAPISSLPFELLSHVLELSMCATVPLHPRRKRESASVSRTWRDVILYSPTFWNNIDLIPGRANMSLVKAHVARSRQCPLDITIQSWQNSHAQLSALLDVIIPHVHRWRTLDIRLNSHHCLQHVLDKINGLKFPSLTRAAIVATAYIQYPSFLRPENSPSLENLELRPLIPTDNFPAGERITTLSLQFSPHRFEPLTLTSLLSSQKLTTLELAYSDYHSLKPDSISLPFLTSLTLKAMYPRELISAIVAPKLSDLYFAAVVPCDQLSTVFYGFESKFRNVQHLVLDAPSSILAVECADVVSSVFRNVRDVEMRTMETHVFFRTNLDGSCPADRWESLASLTFREMGAYYESSTEHLVRWLQQRKLAGRAMLRVKLVDCIFRSDHDDDGDVNDGYGSRPFSLLDLYDSLREICILDIVGVSLKTEVNLSLSSSSPPQLFLPDLSHLLSDHVHQAGKSSGTRILTCR